MSQPIILSSFQELVNQYRTKGLGVLTLREKRRKERRERENNSSLMIIPAGSKPKTTREVKEVKPHSPRLDSDMAHYMEEYSKQFGLV